ncbi:MAG: hypothetical protein ACRENU_08955, partial [Gemmatimonadaceae bacterium]
MIALLFAGACFDSFLVEPKPNVEPGFSVNVQVDQDAAVRYLVRGLFHPGTRSDGNLREITDSSMQVAGVGVMAELRADRQSINYAWADSTLHDTLAVRGPTVADQTTQTTTILIPVAYRVDPGFRNHVAGQDFQFDVAAFGG